MPNFCHIESDFGAVGIAWSERGVVALRLPETDGSSAMGRFIARTGAVEAVPPAWLKPTIDGLGRYFAGTEVDLSSSPIDLDGVPAFHRALYLEMLKLAWGETVTYGALGDRVGAPGTARDVGQAMGLNPIPVIVPCHRVLASGNKLGGFSAPGGNRTKLTLLRMEGARLGAHDPAQMAFGF